LRRSSRLRPNEISPHTTTLIIPEEKKKKREENKSTSVIPHSLSSPFRHEQENNHHMNWESFNVFWRDNNAYNLLLKESPVIKAHQTALNRTTHSIPLVIFAEGLPPDLIPNPNR